MKFAQSFFKRIRTYSCITMEPSKEDEGTRHETVVRQSARRVRDKKTEDPEQNQDESLPHKKQDKKKDAVQVKVRDL